MADLQHFSLIIDNQIVMTPIRPIIDCFKYRSSTILEYQADPICYLNSLPNQKTRTRPNQNQIQIKPPNIAPQHICTKICLIAQVRLLHGLQRSRWQEMVLHKNIEQFSVAPRSYRKEGVLGLLRGRLP